MAEKKTVMRDVEVSRDDETNEPKFTDATPAADAPPAEPVAPFVPRYNAEGVLLNPEECQVGPEGLVTGKSNT